MLEIEINIDDDIVERCVIYTDDTPESVAKNLIEKYKLNYEERKIILDQLRGYF